MPPKPTPTVREEKKSPFEKVVDAVKPPAWAVVSLAVIFVFGAIIVLVIAPRVVPEATNLRVTVGENGFSIDIGTEGNVDYVVLLDSLAHDSLRRPLLLAYLADKLELYPLSDTHLVAELASSLGMHRIDNVDFVAELADMLPDRVRVADDLNETERLETDLERTKRLDSLINTSSLLGIRELRERAEDSLVPFQDFGNTMEVGIPDSLSRPLPYTLHVRVDDAYAHQVVEVTSPNYPGRSLSLLALPCIENNISNVPAHMNKLQADYLGLSFSSTRESVSIRRLHGRRLMLRDVGVDQVQRDTTPFESFENKKCPWDL